MTILTTEVSVFFSCTTYLHIYIAFEAKLVVSYHHQYLGFHVLSTARVNIQLFYSIQRLPHCHPVAHWVDQSVEDLRCKICVGIKAAGLSLDVSTSQTKLSTLYRKVMHRRCVYYKYNELTPQDRIQNSSWNCPIAWSTVA